MGRCVKIRVPKECCYIDFRTRQGKRDVEFSVAGDDVGLTQHGFRLETAQGDEMILDIDKNGRVLGIELLGAKLGVKPCQGGNEDVSPMKLVKSSKRSP